MKAEEFKENYGNGWISLYRSIQNHWIFSNNDWFKWWIIMLFEVNHLDNRWAVGYDVYNIKRGQSTNSYRTWAKLFGCSTKTVFKFFELLEKDEMISKKTIGKGKRSTTLITIENYGQYQSVKKHKVNTTETQSKHNRDTNNNGNNDNNDNNKHIPDFEVFKKYAKEKKKNIDIPSLKLKYDSWIENGWKNGNDKAIKNWKTALLNTLPYIKETKNNITPQYEKM